MLPLPATSEDQLRREEIPTRESLPTAYHPVRNFLMIVPVQELEQIRGIHIPQAHRHILNEGHIVEMGPHCDPTEYQVGDCVTWDVSSEYIMEVDGVKFVLVATPNIMLRIPRAELVEFKQRRADEVQPKLPFDAKTGINVCPDCRAEVDLCVCSQVAPNIPGGEESSMKFPGEHLPPGRPEEK